MKLVCISDTHGHTDLQVQDGDVLIHAGDLTPRGTIESFRQGIEWLGSLPHKAKLFVPGNHDFCCEKNPDLSDSICHAHGVHLLIDKSISVFGFRYYGSPWQPWFHDWAFNLKSEEHLRRVWEKVPTNTDVLITHCPPFGIQDPGFGGRSIGCPHLRAAVLQRIRPSVHVYGHAHQGHGAVTHGEPSTLFINASLCNDRNELVRGSITYTLPLEEHSHD